jgi:superkiller protein 3
MARYSKGPPFSAKRASLRKGPGPWANANVRVSIFKDADLKLMTLADTDRVALQAEELHVRCAALREDGRPAEVLSLLEAEAAPDLAMPYACLRALVLSDLGRYAEALEVCDRVLQTAPQEREAFFTRAFALVMLERWQEALATLDTLVGLDPTYPDAAWMRAGLLRRQRGDLDDAVLAAFDCALENDPGNLYAQVERADLLRSRGNYTEARNIYARVREASPDDTLRLEATFKLGCVALVLQDEIEARKALESVLAVAPDYPDVRDLLDLLDGDTEPRT